MKYLLSAWILQKELKVRLKMLILCRNLGLIKSSKFTKISYAPYWRSAAESAEADEENSGLFCDSVDHSYLLDVSHLKWFNIIKRV